ncbi:MAG: hypothetical protein WC080_00065 [Patescibacteria group bacterium]|jgi:hypothetical protein
MRKANDYGSVEQSPFNSAELPPIDREKKAEEQVLKICDFLKAQGIIINPMVAEYFEDPDLYESLPENIRSSDNRMAELIAHSMAFSDFAYKARKKRWGGDVSGFLGKEVTIPETPHNDGQVRQSETGYQVNLEALGDEKINPDLVLFFRVTQPSESPKPEYYWMSDYYEAKNGLTAEIPPEQRENAIILVSSLRTIATNEGLIHDVNDDQGMSVRQIGIGTFDQKDCLATITPKKP